MGWVARWVFRSTSHGTNEAKMKVWGSECLSVLLLLSVVAVVVMGWVTRWVFRSTSHGTGTNDAEVEVWGSECLSRYSPNASLADEGSLPGTLPSAKRLAWRPPEPPNPGLRPGGNRPMVCKRQIPPTPNTQRKGEGPGQISTALRGGCRAGDPRGDVRRAAATKKSYFRRWFGCLSTLALLRGMHYRFVVHCAEVGPAAGVRRSGNFGAVHSTIGITFGARETAGRRLLVGGGGYGVHRRRAHGRNVGRRPRTLTARTWMRFRSRRWMAGAASTPSADVGAPGGGVPPWEGHGGPLSRHGEPLGWSALRGTGAEEKVTNWRYPAFRALLPSSVPGTCPTWRRKCSSTTFLGSQRRFGVRAVRSGSWLKVVLNGETTQMCK